MLHSVGVLTLVHALRTSPLQGDTLPMQTDPWRVQTWHAHAAQAAHLPRDALPAWDDPQPLGDSGHNG